MYVLPEYTIRISSTYIYIYTWIQYIHAAGITVKKKQSPTKTTFEYGLWIEDDWYTKTTCKNTEYGGSGPLRFAKPQSCKASLALHASKLQSLKAAKPLWRLTPQSLKAPKPLWRLTPQSLKASKLQSLFGASRFKASKPQSLKAWTLGCFGALALGGSFRLWRFLALFRRLKASKPQSLNAWMLWRFGALALGGSFRLWRFLALFRRLKASKPERLDAVALWRFGAWRLLHALALLDAFPTPQSLKAWTLGCFGASARVLRLKASKPERLDALALWRFGAWRSWCFGASWPFGALQLFDALALWRFGAWRSWCFGASWPFGALRLFDALALLGALRLRGSVTLWHFAALWDMPSWKKKEWFCRCYFFSSTDWNIGIKAVSEKKQRARLFVFEGQRSPAASELTTTCLVIFVGCLMMVYLSRWLTSVVCKSPFRGS